MRPEAKSYGERPLVAPCSRWLAMAKQFVADSLLEGAVSSEPVSEAKFPASRQNTGNFVDSGFGSASTAAKKGSISQPYGRIPYAF
jgi:hypothetical protein